MSLSWIYQVAITAPWITAKHLVVSVSTEVLKKTHKQKDPQNCYQSYIPVFTQMQEKVFVTPRKFSSWQSVQRSREAICQQTSLQMDHFYWSQVGWDAFTEKCEDKCPKRQVSSVDFRYMECSVFLCEMCWLALTDCFFSENNGEKKYCPGLDMEL